MSLRPLRLCVVATAFVAVRGAPAQSAAEIPRFEPGAFRSTTVDNPLFPLKPGTVYVFEVKEDDETSLDSITVTSNVKRVAGVQAIVVHDRVRRGGRITEDTYDWYAQDTVGNVWYLGEDTRAYKFARFFSRSGSWQAGEKGAQPGIIMLGRPRVGASYRQEYRKGSAEDMGRVISVGETVTVPAGKFTGCITTEDWSPLEKGVLEHKTYCPGVGVVRELTVSGGNERSELKSIVRP